MITVRQVFDEMLRLLLAYQKERKNRAAFYLFIRVLSLNDCNVLLGHTSYDHGPFIGNQWAALPRRKDSRRQEKPSDEWLQFSTLAPT